MTTLLLLLSLSTRRVMAAAAAAATSELKLVSVSIDQIEDGGGFTHKIPFVCALQLISFSVSFEVHSLNLVEYFTVGRILLGYAYPSFQCFKALEGNRASGGELRFWCQYWIIMALLNILERAADVIISWLPMYGELKLAFIIYLWYPKTKGTGYIYETVLRPFVTNHETDLEKKLPEWRAKAWDLAIYYLQNCSDLGQSAIFQVLEYTAGQSGKSSKSSNKARLALYSFCPLD
ncbi:hypothetical protein SAY87_030034 [Trapa incisa]|uniref:HVA22-like protein n=1 Tax=Trapa incisa TaxID=236973 RepID=A0AAN7K7K9_9MYRT|nr:hypothetical protein SAY87_030034 [Trapa incisa]